MKKMPLKWWIQTFTIAFLSCAYLVGLFTGSFYAFEGQGIFWMTVWMASSLLGPLLAATQCSFCGKDFGKDVMTTNEKILRELRIANAAKGYGGPISFGIKLMFGALFVMWLYVLAGGKLS